MNPATVAAYVRRFPHLDVLARAAAGGDPRAVKAFAQAACRGAAPADVSPRDVRALARLAEPRAAG
jgi:hypothetical protein